MPSYFLCFLTFNSENGKSRKRSAKVYFIISLHEIQKAYIFSFLKFNDSKIYPRRVVDYVQGV